MNDQDAEVPAGGSPVTMPIPHIGAFVLETLTLGMYGEPRHTLREYVQNSFDAIRAAQRTRFLTQRGKVTITMGEDDITIRDNGIGVSASQAWKTLTSIGASKKDRQHDAGFRGIGRLAGMAYCDELIFRTTFPGEFEISTLTFDCDALLKAMNPDEGGDVELSGLLSRSIGMTTTVDESQKDAHFFEVMLRGLSKAPEILKNPSEVRDYLAETVPVDFRPDWNRKKSIEDGYRANFGTPLETIDVFVQADGLAEQIFKHYGDSYEHAKGEMELESIEYFSGSKSRFWAWVGTMGESAAVTDWRTRGLRVRVRNIQVDGTEISESLFSRVKPSYGRFSTYYVGEIYIDPESVIPNARRDGFEENQDWLDIRSELITSVCKPLASRAYSASQQGQLDVEKVVGEINELVERGNAIADSTKSSYDQVVELMNSARRLRRRAVSALKIVDDLDATAVDDGKPKDQRSVVLQDAAKSVETVETQARMLVGRFLGEDDKLTALKARLREEILQEVLDVVNAFVDPATYQKIRRQLLKTK
ncbi:ATP-binding protein [Bradyrhizobium sp. SZCCHNS2002]|uniref:ATP-binding protein n=1 Tax=Bradyrhizobium sp. SZCCHNS2002 TaxID=3057302 RepID=UPI002915C747|nr:ATP-binding protein [Bradyrhizobium sp. SZCCHNS2002]